MTAAQPASPTYEERLFASVAIESSEQVNKGRDLLAEWDAQVPSEGWTVHEQLVALDQDVLAQHGEVPVPELAIPQVATWDEIGERLRALKAGEGDLSAQAGTASQPSADHIEQ